MIIVGLDIGASKVAIKVVDQNKSTSNVLSLPVTNDFSNDIFIIKKLLNSVLYGDQKKKINKCVCSLAANIDDDGVIVRWPNRSHWVGNNFKKILCDFLKVKVYFIDDGIAAAHAESFFHKMSSVLYFGIGSGIASGLVSKKKSIIYGLHNNVEFGHMVVKRKGLLCSCGKYGCLQAYASGRSILKNAYGDNWLCKTKQQLFADLQNNNQQVVLAVDLAAKMLVQASMQIDKVAKFSNIVIGGGMGYDFFVLIKKIEFYLKALFTNSHIATNVHVAKCGAQSSLEGAVYLAQKQIGDLL